MNNLKIFESNEFGSIRIVVDGEKYFFCGMDAARALGYKDTVNALKAHCKEDGVAFYHLTDSLGREQKAKFISEGNLYRLIVHSKLPSAERFERWVFDEVLLSIRQHGAYMTENTLEQALTNPDFLIQLATKLKEEQEARKKLEAKVKEDEPHAILGRAITTAKTTILVGDLAKILKKNGVEVGAKRLFEWLRENGYLIKRKGTDWNLPTQRSMEMGLFEIKESVHVDGNGCNKITRTPKVTGKGQQYFINKFLAGAM